VGLHNYNVILKANIEIGGVFNADTAAEAVELAKLELRSGEISDIQTERAMLLDEEETTA
jgi:hypothetical protein